MIVRVSTEAPPSPHVVNLRTESQEKEWHGITPYQTEKGSLHRPGTVDFASMVKAANSRRTMPVSTPTIRVVSERKKGQKSFSSLFRKWAALPYRVADICAQTIRRAGEGTNAYLHHVQTTFSFRQFAFRAIVVALIVSLPLPAMGYYRKMKVTTEKVVEESTRAFLSLQSSTVAAMQANLGVAQTELATALQGFETADSLIEKDARGLLYVARLLPVVGNQVASRQHLLSAGHHLALGNTYIVKGVSDAGKEQALPLTDRLNIFRDHLISALPQYEAALRDLEQIDVKSIPPEYQQTFVDFKLLFATFIDDMSDVVQLADAMRLIFGGEEFRRYLVLFQNQHELRPAGGFMGSFALIDVQKGKIMNIDVPGGGTYDLKGQMKTHVKPPLPLQLVNGKWEFQDANWFPHFPATAEKAEWFYADARGATVDGVIAINASVLERVLKVVGPLAVDDAMVLDHMNALPTLQTEVEVNYDRTKNKPKEAIGTVLTVLTERMKTLSSDELLRMTATLHEALNTKEIQIYMNDPVVERQLQSFGWTGEMASTEKEQDYLAVIQANVQGQKSDAKIEQTIEHQAEVMSDGSIIDTVIVRREHRGIPDEAFYGADNMSYVRVYVPEGAELLEAGGFTSPPEEAFHAPESWYAEDIDVTKAEKEVGFHEKTGTRITQEFGKTVFGNWSFTPAGGTSEVYFVYKLPAHIRISGAPLSRMQASWQKILHQKNTQTTRYSLYVQKQSGIDSTVLSTVIFPEGWLPVWKSHDDIALALNGATLETRLTADRVYGVVMEQQKP
ncbi:MAG TPA: DUF4012 domain-containing protein [Candidatus Kapabacteria bacterium]|nr:DUF4012 domain-containing protein [Candidatus Kapabacteria bacterium]